MPPTDAPPAPPLPERIEGDPPRRGFFSWLIRGETPTASHALLLPTSAWLAAFLVVPLALLVFLSLTVRGDYGALQWAAYTLENFKRCLDPVFLPVLLRTFAYAATATAVCLVLGYPFAYFLVFHAKLRKDVLLLLLMLPFWTSSLVSLYAWMILLGREGLVNNVLIGLGLVSEPVQFLNRPFAVLLGLTYSYLPFTILPIYGALEKMPKTYIEAAKDLGAGPVRTFLKITLPLSMHGVLAALILTFIPCLGDFLSAEFLGGPSTYLIGNLIQNQFLMAQDWPFGASLATILLLCLGAGVFYYQKLGEPDESQVRTPA